MAQLYTNAAEVLPPELLAQVQKHWQGYMWVPARTHMPQNKVIQLIQKGLSAEVIADTLGLTPGRVYQIARSLGKDNPFRRNKTVSAMEL